MPLEEDFQLGEFVVRRGLASQEQIDECLCAQQRAEEIGMIGTLAGILLAKGILTREQVEKLAREMADPGRTVRNFGPFEILEKLPPSPLGSLYRALDSQLRIEVCLRLLNPRLAEKSGYVAELLKEVPRAASIVHPALVQVYKAGEINGRCYVSQEFVSGETAQRKVEMGGPLPPQEALSAVRQIAEGLAYASSLGSFPADIRPKNILFARGLKGVKLADFGWPKESRSGIYLSPQELEGGPQDATAMVYSLGSCLFFLITGADPFPAQDNAELLRAHQEGSVPLASSVNEAISEELAKFVQRWMAKKPEDRPATLEAAIQELEKVAGLVTEAVGQDSGQPQPSAPPPAPALTPPTTPEAAGDRGGKTKVDSPDTSAGTQPPEGASKKTRPVVASATDRAPTRSMAAASPPSPPKIEKLEYTVESVDRDSETVTVGSETKFELLKAMEEKRKSEQAATRSLGETAKGEEASADIVPLSSSGNVQPGDAPSGEEEKIPSQGTEVEEVEQEVEETEEKKSSISRVHQPKGRRRASTDRSSRKMESPWALISTLSGVLLLILVGLWASRRSEDGEGSDGLEEPPPKPQSQAPARTSDPTGAPPVKAKKPSEAAPADSRAQALEAVEWKIRELESLTPVPQGQLISAYQRLFKLVAGTARAEEIRQKIESLKKDEEEQALASFQATKAEADALFEKRRFRAAMNLLDKFPQEQRVLVVMTQWKAARERYQQQVMDSYLDARSKIAEWTEEVNLGSGGAELPSKEQVQEVEETLGAVIGFANGPTAAEARRALLQLEGYAKKNGIWR